MNRRSRVQSKRRLSFECTAKESEPAKKKEKENEKEKEKENEKEKEKEKEKENEKEKEVEETDGDNEEEENREGDYPSEDDVNEDGEGGEEMTGAPEVEEQSCMELALLFGNEAREDYCEMDADSGDDVCDEDNILEPISSDEENEKNGWLGEAYRLDVVLEEILKLGKTFCDADDFKHACVTYTLKTRYNIKFYQSGAYKIGAKCAATPKRNQPPCPWKIYCSFEKSKMRLQIKTYNNVHTCEKTGDSKMLKRSAIANLFAARLRLEPKLKAKKIASKIRREFQMNVSENSCSKAKTKVMNERKRSQEQHFDRIWDYQAEVLKQNPGSTFDIETIPGPFIHSKQSMGNLTSFTMLRR